MLTLQAPSKINLTLEVLGKRQDGYHEVRSVIQTVGLYDTLHFEPSRKNVITSAAPEFNGDASLISKTLKLVQKAARVKKGVSIHVEKRIPLFSGMGGDSSDAAATLKGLAQLWDLDINREQMYQYAAELGSDVSFFIDGGTALAEGRGEKIQQLSPFPRRWVVIVLPRVPMEPGKTAQMYASLKPAYCSDGQVTRRLVEALITGLPVRQTMFVNSFEHVAFHRDSVLSTYRDHLLKIGAPHVHLCGSGPAMFVMLDDKGLADDLAVKCQNQGVRALVVSTL